MAADGPERVTGSLALIARHSVLLPDERGRPLRIPGVDGRTYAECIGPIGNFDGNVAPRHPYRVLHGPVAFREGVAEQGPVNITLFRGRRRLPEPGGRSRLDPRYVVSFDTAAWPEAQVSGIRRNAQAWVDDQRRRGDDDLEVHLFFLGRQSADGMGFVVSDWRLACFQTMPRR